MLKKWLFLLLMFGSVPSPAQAGVCEEWNHLFVQIRDFQLAPEAAKTAFAPLHQQLRDIYARPGVGGPARFYPVVGYDTRWGVEGKGYRPRGFRFFTGNSQGIHPSLDLFILDKDQDSRDDRSQAPVTIVAYSGGVVVGVNREWEFPSPIRGGKYVWIFDPTTDHYSYYAHLSRVDVELGQIVQAGEPLGLLGRTGLNAYKKRSPTHLHLMVLAYQHGEMEPYTPWPELVSARVK